MKLLKKWREQRATNCTGPMEWFDVAHHAVESEDVGKPRDNYGGHNHSTYKLLRSDVGRTIETVSQPGGYRCWYFHSGGQHGQSV